MLQAGNSDHHRRIHRIIMSVKESDSMQLISNKLKSLNDSLQNNAAQITVARQNAQKYKEEIQSEFAILRLTLNEREQELTKQLDKATNRIIHQLEGIEHGHMKHIDLLKRTKKKQDALLLDPNIDAKDRESAIHAFSMSALSQIDREQMDVDINHVTLSMSSKTAREVLCVHT